METTYDIYADLKGMIIDAITRSMDDEDDFDLVMAIGEKIAELQKIHRELEHDRDMYKKWWMESQKELKDQVKEKNELRKSIVSLNEIIKES